MVTDKIVEVRQHIIKLREGVDEFYEAASPNSSKILSDLFLVLNQDIDDLQQELNEIQGEVFALLLKLNDKEN
jgi:hypothetical protein